MSRRRLTAYTFLLITSIIWGVAGPVIKYTLFYFPPLILLTYRFAISSIIGLVILGATKQKLPGKSSLLLLLLFSGFITTTLRLGTLFFGFDETTSLAGSMISATGPIMLTLLGGYFFHEHVTRLEKVGMMIAFFGTVISVVEPIFASETALQTTLNGNILITISLFIDVAAIFLGKYLYKKGILPSLHTNLAFIIGFVTILPLALYKYPLQTIFSSILMAPPDAHLGVLFMALISGTLAYWLHGKGLKKIEMGEASVFAYLSPVWAAPLSLFWLHERVTGPFIFGAALVFVGVGLAEYKRRTA